MTPVFQVPMVHSVVRRQRTESLAERMAALRSPGPTATRVDLARLKSFASKFPRRDQTLSFPHINDYFGTLYKYVH